MINVSWEDAKAYVSWLSQHTGKPYRLPSEAEWEYAARAGTTTRYPFGDAITPKDANCCDKLGKTTEVGAYPPNAWGLYDMQGNVYERVEDTWHRSYKGAPVDGSAWTDGEQHLRVERGGSWLSDAWTDRPATRSFGGRSSFDGFRVARTLERQSLLHRIKVLTLGPQQNFPSPAKNNQTQPFVQYEHRADEILLQKIQNRNRLSSSDLTAKNKIISQLPKGELSGTLFTTSDVHIDYIHSADVFQGVITTTNVDQAKQEAVNWFLSQGFSQDAICNYPVYFYLSPDAASELKNSNPSITVSTLPPNCQLTAATLAAANFPALTGRVVDDAHILSPITIADLERKLANLEQKSGIQLVVASVPSLDGEELEPYATTLFNTWKLGEAKQNNGVLLLIAPKERRVRIEVGYGLEGTLTNAVSSVILANAIVPRFNAGDYNGGVTRGVDDIITALAEWKPKQTDTHAEHEPQVNAPSTINTTTQNGIVPLNQIPTESPPNTNPLVAWDPKQLVYLLKEE